MLTTAHLFKLPDLLDDTVSEFFFRQRPILLQRGDRFILGQPNTLVISINSVSCSFALPQHYEACIPRLP